MSSEHDMTPAEAVAELHRRGSTPEKPDEYGTRVRILPGT
jgi:lambda repressor-like predicted transcriptional regulator